MGEVLPIRDNVLYLYLDGEFFRAYDSQEELTKALDYYADRQWSLYDNMMNLVGEP